MPKFDDSTTLWALQYLAHHLNDVRTFVNVGLRAALAAPFFPEAPAKRAAILNQLARDLDGLIRALLLIRRSIRAGMCLCETCANERTAARDEAREIMLHE